MKLHAICLKDEKTGEMILVTDAINGIRVHATEQDARARGVSLFGEVPARKVYIACIGKIDDKQFREAVPSELVKKYDLHPEILKKVADGTLEYIQENQGALHFRIPALEDHDSQVILKWHGTDHDTWALSGIRFMAEREHDNHGEAEEWSPTNCRGEDSEQTPEEHEENVEEFLCWLARD